jgi:L-fucose isomerase-like protein
MSNMPIRLGLIAVANPLEVGAADAPALLERLAAALAEGQPQLEECVRQVVTDPQSAVAAGRLCYDQRVDALCVIAAAWFEDYLVLDLLEECRAPVIAWARPGMETGSLCGMQQLCFILRELRRPYLFLFEPADSRTGIQRATAYAMAAALANQLRRARIGFLGQRIQGMTEITAHELALKGAFGPRVVGIDSHAFAQRVETIEPDGLAQGWQALAARVGSVTATAEAGLESLRVYEALKAEAVEGGLSAVAAGCYPHLMGKVCLAASLLGEQGIPVACEGDVNGALGMLILTRLSAQPVHNADLLDPIPAENSIIFSHCGAGAFSLAADPAQITLGPVRLMNRGVCCLFPARPGPVTLLNIVPTLDGYRMAVLPGQAIETDMVFPGNPLRVQFQPDYRRILAWIAGQGLGHHWMAGYGDLAQPLSDLSALTGCELVQMN